MACEVTNIKISQKYKPNQGHISKFVDLELNLDTNIYKRSRKISPSFDKDNGTSYIQAIDNVIRRRIMLEEVKGEQQKERAQHVLKRIC
jgi:hypothetical protein